MHAYKIDTQVYYCLIKKVDNDQENVGPRIRLISTMTPTTRTSAKTLEELIMKMEEDASNVLSFMASNGLVANASRTSFVVLNLCKSDRDEAKINPLKVKIGPTTVTQEHSAKLLGITFNDKQNWSTQINGHGGVISSLNKRLFTIKRLKNHVNSKSLVKLVDGLFTSKINYGLQLYGKVRMFSSDKVTKDLKSVQKVQIRWLVF